MKNKVLREKSKRVDCWSSKSRFLKQKDNKNNSKTKYSSKFVLLKNKKIVSRNYKTCIFIAKSAKITQVTRFQKN